MEAEKVKQMAFRVYPATFTGNTLKELNGLLKDGWIVKITLPEPFTSGSTKNTIHLLILEKQA